MKTRIWPIATAAAFGLGLMFNLGCPAQGSTSSGCPGSVPASVPSCGSGTVDRGDGAGCVPYTSSSSSSSNPSSTGRCPTNMTLVDGRCTATPM